MSDLGTIEKRTVYQIPEGKDLYSPYVGSDPWPERTVTIHGDMLPVEQHAISWCTFHNSPEKGGGFCWHNHDVLLNPKVPLVRLGDCVISTSGPEHKWWVDV